MAFLFFLQGAVCGQISALSCHETVMALSSLQRQKVLPLTDHERENAYELEKVTRLMAQYKGPNFTVHVPAEFFKIRSFRAWDYLALREWRDPREAYEVIAMDKDSEIMDRRLYLHISRHTEVRHEEALEAAVVATHLRTDPDIYIFKRRQGQKHRSALSQMMAGPQEGPQRVPPGELGLLLKDVRRELKDWRKQWREETNDFAEVNLRDLPAWRLRLYLWPEFVVDVLKRAERGEINLEAYVKFRDREASSGLEGNHWNRERPEIETMSHMGRREKIHWGVLEQVSRKVGSDLRLFEAWKDFSARGMGFGLSQEAVGLLQRGYSREDMIWLYEWAKRDPVRYENTFSYVGSSFAQVLTAFKEKRFGRYDLDLAYRFFEDSGVRLHNAGYLDIAEALARGEVRASVMVEVLKRLSEIHGLGWWALDVARAVERRELTIEGYIKGLRLTRRHEWALRLGLKTKTRKIVEFEDVQALVENFRTRWREFEIENVTTEAGREPIALDILYSAVRHLADFPFEPIHQVLRRHDFVDSAKRLKKILAQAAKGRANEVHELMKTVNAEKSRAEQVTEWLEEYQRRIEVLDETLHLYGEFLASVESVPGETKTKGAAKSGTVGSADKKSELEKLRLHVEKVRSLSDEALEGHRNHLLSLGQMNQMATRYFESLWAGQRALEGVP